MGDYSRTLVPIWSDMYEYAHQFLRRPECYPTGVNVVEEADYLKYHVYNPKTPDEIAQPLNLADYSMIVLGPEAFDHLSANDPLTFDSLFYWVATSGMKSQGESNDFVPRLLILGGDGRTTRATDIKINKFMSDFFDLGIASGITNFYDTKPSPGGIGAIKSYSQYPTGVVPRNLDCSLRLSDNAYTMSAVRSSQPGKINSFYSMFFESSLGPLTGGCMCFVDRPRITSYGDNFCWWAGLVTLSRSNFNVSVQTLLVANKDVFSEQNLQYDENVFLARQFFPCSYYCDFDGWVGSGTECVPCPGECRTFNTKINPRCCVQTLRGITNTQIQLYLRNQPTPFRYKLTTSKGDVVPLVFTKPFATTNGEIPIWAINDGHRSNPNLGGPAGSASDGYFVNARYNQDGSFTLSGNSYYEQEAIFGVGGFHTIRTGTQYTYPNFNLCGVNDIPWKIDDPDERDTICYAPLNAYVDGISPSTLPAGMGIAYYNNIKFTISGRDIGGASGIFFNGGTQNNWFFKYINYIDKDHVEASGLDSAFRPGNPILIGVNTLTNFNLCRDSVHASSVVPITVTLV
jgi:hypothetical protein